MKVSGTKLRRIITYVYNEFLVDNVNVDADMCNGIQDALIELKSLRELKRKAERFLLAGDDAPTQGNKV